jgi:erythronate-4-phosphate dehydrogenase
MRPDAIIINASRGEVVDNRAVANSGHRYIFDVWESEPDLDGDILQGAMLATPHIAGYSVQGKANATAMAINALSRHFDLPLTDWYPEGVKRTTPRLISWEELCSTISEYCNIEKESLLLKNSPQNFEHIRNTYNYREEYF